MTTVAEFILSVVGMIISKLFATYLVRFLDKLKHKNNRHES